jgi:hypothetical protein
MNRLTQIMAVAGTALLIGCATAAQRQYQAIAVNNQSVVAQLKQCGLELYNSQEATPIRPHYPIDPRDIGLSQLADTSLATREEIDAILVLYPRLPQCQKAALEGLSRATPSFVPILAAEYREGLDNALLLVQRREAWGEFSKRRRDNAMAAMAALQAEAQRLTGNLEQAHEAEVERRRAAAQATLAGLAAAGESFAARARMNQPVNCITMDIRPGFQTTSCR